MSVLDAVSNGFVLAALFFGLSSLFVRLLLWLDSTDDGGYGGE